MSQTLLQIQPYWATQSGLTSLVPASSVWVDVAADGSSLPYVVLKQVKQDFDWTFNNHYIQKTTFTITAYALTLASVDAITTAVISAFKWQNITVNGIFCRLMNQMEKGEEQGAYSATTTWEIWEAF